MKKIIILSLFSALLFSYQLSLAESFPTTCPTEAQGILKAVGGCSTIDCKTYSNICAKCCVAVTAPAKTTTPAPTETSAQQSSAKQLSATTSIDSLTSTTTDSSLEQTSSATVPSVEETVESTPAPQAKKEPQNVLIRFFNWLFRRNK